MRRSLIFALIILFPIVALANDKNVIRNEGAELQTAAVRNSALAQRIIAQLEHGETWHMRAYKKYSYGAVLAVCACDRVKYDFYWTGHTALGSWLSIAFRPDKTLDPLLVEYVRDDGPRGQVIFGAKPRRLEDPEEAHRLFTDRKGRQYYSYYQGRYEKALACAERTILASR